MLVTDLSSLFVPYLDPRGWSISVRIICQSPPLINSVALVVEFYQILFFTLTDIDNVRRSGHSTKQILFACHGLRTTWLVRHCEKSSQSSLLLRNLFRLWIEVCNQSIKMFSIFPSFEAYPSFCFLDFRATSSSTQLPAQPSHIAFPVHRRGRDSCQC